MARSEALVTPSVLKWAREAAGYDIAAAAERIGRPITEIEAWENGTQLPTLSQARKASEVYKRSLAVFYLPEPPKDFDTLRDFRQLPTEEARQYGPELALLVRQILARQEWLRNYLIYEGAGELPFVGCCRSTREARAIAKSIRSELRLTAADQLAARGRREALIMWIERAEQLGICVCRQGKVDCREARGFALTDPYVPFIYLNTTDALSAQLFTLVHELAHVWLDQPGISNLEGIDAPAHNKEARIEILCNRVAAEVLIDRQVFGQLWPSTSDLNSLEERIDRISARLKVSEEAIARRLLNDGIITQRRYRQLRKAYGARWQKLSMLTSARSGGNYYHTKVASNSQSFTRSVLAACCDTAITIREATALLGVKANNLGKLSVYAGVPTPIKRVG